MEPGASNCAGEKLRVLMLAPKRGLGGITTWLGNLLKYSDSTLLDYFVIDTSKLYDPLGKRLDFRGAFLGLIAGVRRMVRLFLCLSGYRPDLVYLTCSPGPGFKSRDVFYLYLLRLLRMPVVVHMHGGNADGFFGNGIVRRRIIIPLLNDCRIIIVITREMEKIARRYLGRAEVVYMPNMIDDELAESATVDAISINCRDAASPIRLLHVGYQCTEKGSLDIIRALAAAESPAICRLVGDAAPENRDAILGLASTLRLDERVIMSGRKTGKDLKDMFQSSDIFVFPSHSEGFPNVILEAMAYGLPVIASEVGNMPEMLGVGSDNQSGLVFGRSGKADGDIQRELAALIDRLTADDELRKKLGDAGKYRVRQYYAASRVVPRLEQLISLLALHGKRDGKAVA